MRDGAFEPSADPAWGGLLEASRVALDRAIAGVGRIERRHPDRVESLGTGWLVRGDVVVTNRHIVAEFREPLARGEVQLAINFLAERDADETRARQIVEVIHVADDCDLAFVRLAPGDSGAIAEPIVALSRACPRPGQAVCAIGYPTKRLAHHDPALVRACFADPFDVKRLAPGRITMSQADRVGHDCATLSGNSGGALLDLASGEAVGLHYGGRFGACNYAVPAAIMRERLERLERLVRPG